MSGNRTKRDDETYGEWLLRAFGERAQEHYWRLVRLGMGHHKAAKEAEAAHEPR